MNRKTGEKMDQNAADTILAELKKLETAISELHGKIGSVIPGQTIVAQISKLHTAIGDIDSKHTITDQLVTFRREASAGFTQINKRLDDLDERFNAEGNDILLAEIVKVREQLDGEAEARQSFYRILSDKIDEDRREIGALKKRVAVLTGDPKAS